ncbi:12225_t:CDS:2 [Entrophospora sp. SA101]|nr:12225_t:CDS:2 [Entrophospora sp. SA101]
MERLNLFLNRPNVHFEFEDNIANMNDVLKVKHTLKLLDEMPGFQLDKDYISFRYSLESFSGVISLRFLHGQCLYADQ